MKTIILIIASGLLVGGFAALAEMIIWNWAWFKQRREIPPVDPRVRFRTELWGRDSHHIIN